MKKWQILEFDGRPYYAFVPENDAPLPDEETPEEASFDDMDHEIKQEVIPKIECLYGEDYDSMDERLYADEEDEEEQGDEESSLLHETSVPIDSLGMKQLLSNGNEIDKTTLGDLYQVKVQGSMVTIEKLTTNEMEEKTSNYQPLERDYNENVENLGDMESVGNAANMANLDNLRHVGHPGNEENMECIENVEHENYENEGNVINVENDENDENDENLENIEYLEEDLLAISNNHVTPLKSRKKPGKHGGGALKCKLCSEMFSSAISFRKHVAWTHKKKVCIQEDGAYICAVCDYRTLKKSLFAAHLERKHETWSRKRPNNVLFPCVACGFVCRSKHSLQSHFIRKHTDKYEHQCKFCPKKFKVKGDLTNHVRFHHKEKPVNCDVCGKLCQNSGSLYVHQKWAHYKPKFECHICKRRMVTQENLDQHLLTQHEKREKIVCAECGKTFTKKDSFKRHMAVHTGCKPHSCLICNKPFARRSQLRQHLLIHTGKRPFVCDICGKAFTQKPGLICHRKTHPGPHPPLPVMPIADIVKEFTEGYVQEINARGNDELIEEELMEEET